MTPKSLGQFVILEEQNHESYKEILLCKGGMYSLRFICNRHLALTENVISMDTFNILQHTYIQVTFPNSMPNTINSSSKVPMVLTKILFGRKEYIIILLENNFMFLLDQLYFNYFNKIHWPFLFFSVEAKPLLDKLSTNWNFFGQLWSHVVISSLPP